VICVSLSTVKDAATPPKETSVAVVKLVPTIVTLVPPAVDPVFGVMLVIPGEEVGVVVVVVLVVVVVVVGAAVVVVEVDDEGPAAVDVVGPPGVVVVVVGVGRVGSGAITTCSPRRIRTNSSTVMSGCHRPSLQTRT
jgi:hypothetical protein